MSWLKHCTETCRSVGDHPVSAVVLLNTFLIGALGSFKAGFIAYVVILGAWRILTCRMPTCRDLTLYIVGAVGVSAAFSWLEWADGRTDITRTLIGSVFALCLVLLWVWDGRNR